MTKKTDLSLKFEQNDLEKEAEESQQQ